MLLSAYLKSILVDHELQIHVGLKGKFSQNINTIKTCFQLNTVAVITPSAQWKAALCCQKESRLCDLSEGRWQCHEPLRVKKHLTHSSLVLVSRDFLSCLSFYFPLSCHASILQTFIETNVWTSGIWRFYNDAHGPELAKSSWETLFPITARR